VCCQIHLQGSLLKFICNAVRKKPWNWWFEYEWHEPNSIQLAFGDPCDFIITSISHLGEGKKNLRIAWNHQPARWRKSPRSLPRRRACNTAALEEATACSVSLTHSFPSLISLSLEDLCDLSLYFCLSVSLSLLSVSVSVGLAITLPPYIRPGSWAFCENWRLVCNATENLIFLPKHYAATKGRKP